MQSIKQNLQAVRWQIANLLPNCEQDQQTVTLLAVSKQQSVRAITEALEADQTAFAENYVQEAINKIDYFANTRWAKKIEWHFIGPLQANKSRLVAEHFDWLQTLDRPRIAQRLNQQRPDSLPPLNVLIQINISREMQKSGILPEQVDELADVITSLPRLRLRGLMAIPEQHPHPEQRTLLFEQMQQIFCRLKQRYPRLDTLSLGMSEDMPEAIISGSTMVRIGTAIFGRRGRSAN